MSSTRETVIAVIHEVMRTNTPDLSDETKPLIECGLDSLDFASVLMALEDKYAVEFGEDDMEKLGSIAQLTAFLDAKAG